MPGSFDVVTCMEMLEHVPDPGSVIDACAKLVRPGGHVFFSTLNRNPKSYLFAIVGAEYVLNLLPRGTHDYARFIRPAELDAGCAHGAAHHRPHRPDLQPAHPRSTGSTRRTSRSTTGHLPPPADA
jgi:ubiquinone biosynthesis O-methyltransferase